MRLIRFDGLRDTAGFLLVGPILLFGYGAIRLLDPTHSPGVVWSVSHVFYLLGYLAFGGAALAFRPVFRDESAVPRRVGWALVWAGWLGVLAGVGQAVVDLVAGARAADKAERAVVADQLRAAIPGSSAFYGPVPTLSLLALIRLLALVAARPTWRVPWWSPCLALAATALPTLTLDLIPVAALVLLLAMWPAYRNLRLRSAPVRGEVT